MTFFCFALFSSRKYMPPSNLIEVNVAIDIWSSCVFVAIYEYTHPKIAIYHNNSKHAKFHGNFAQTQRTKHWAQPA